MNWTEIVTLFGASEKRRDLLKALHAACLILKQAGVEKAWLNGSFVTSKPVPRDFDMSYDLSDEAFARLPDYPFKHKNADRVIRAHFGGDIKAEPMADGYRYHIDLWPHLKGHEHEGRSISGLKKGIVLIDLVGLPSRSGIEASI